MDILLPNDINVNPAKYFSKQLLSMDSEVRSLKVDKSTNMIHLKLEDKWTGDKDEIVTCTQKIENNMHKNFKKELDNMSRGSDSNEIMYCQAVSKVLSPNDLLGHLSQMKHKF